MRILSLVFVILFSHISHAVDVVRGPKPQMETYQNLLKEIQSRLSSRGIEVKLELTQWIEVDSKGITLLTMKVKAQYPNGKTMEHMQLLGTYRNKAMMLSNEAIQESLVKKFDRYASLGLPSKIMTDVHSLELVFEKSKAMFERLKALKTEISQNKSSRGKYIGLLTETNRLTLWEGLRDLGRIETKSQNRSVKVDFANTTLDSLSQLEVLNRLSKDLDHAQVALTEETKSAISVQDGDRYGKALQKLHLIKLLKDKAEILCNFLEYDSPAQAEASEQILLDEHLKTLERLHGKEIALILKLVKEDQVGNAELILSQVIELGKSSDGPHGAGVTQLRTNVLLGYSAELTAIDALFRSLEDQSKNNPQVNKLKEIDKAAQEIKGRLTLMLIEARFELQTTQKGGPLMADKYQVEFEVEALKHELKRSLQLQGEVRELIKARAR